MGHRKVKERRIVVVRVRKIQYNKIIRVENVKKEGQGRGVNFYQVSTKETKTRKKSLK